MAKLTYLVWGLFYLWCTPKQTSQSTLELFSDVRVEYMGREEREILKDEAKDMFYHAYNAYMNKAYPADELMPLSCKGRYRGSEPDRGDIDTALGNFSLTLVDTLDTLAVLGDLKEFERGVKLVIKDVKFDTDIIVSVFETNIRMLGGLLSGHILAEYLQQRANILQWYKGELLVLAKDLGYRFLPAFNTTTGIPFGRINLKTGIKGVPLEMMRETCTACAGSMILEMAALSRLTGEPLFEEKAQKAMDALWRLRHRGTDLMGSVLNVNSGDWIRRDSGVGAGIDSYYEYCLKAYILLGDEKYLGRFNKHYQAIMKYISQGPMLLDVHMHRPNTNAKNFMDALLAFWPGLQVLKGDIKPAVETHEMLYQVMQRHNFIPEAFTTDFQVHWGHHPLRPEFLESTYFLYKATGDHYYLGVGKKVLKSLQTYARVPCGFAAVSDVRTNKHDDTMDSFVLSETFKYLYLLFADPSDLLLDLDEFIFTTEGHLLPLTLSSVRTNATDVELEKEKVHVEETDRTCPNSLHLFPASVRKPLRNMVEDICPRRLLKKRLSATNFQPNNLEHIKILSDMGITFLTLSDGSVQLLHTFANAKSSQDAEDGLLFMQEMVELSKTQSKFADTKPIVVSFVKPNSQPQQEVNLLAGPAHFGPKIKPNEKVVGKVVFANPALACNELNNSNLFKGMIVIVERGNCMFVDKAKVIQNAGAIAGIIVDNVPLSSVENSPLFAMTANGKENDDISIPLVFLFSVEASQLKEAVISAQGHLIITIGNNIKKDTVQLKSPTDASIFERFKGTLKDLLTQQITSQNLRLGGIIPMDPKVQKPDEFLKGKEEEDATDIYTYGHLKALVKDVKDNKAIKIKFDFGVPAPENIGLSFNETEAKWTLMKKIMINELYGTVGQDVDVVMLLSDLSEIYLLINKVRGQEEKSIKKANMDNKVIWLLQELSQIRPNPSIIQLYLELYKDVNKQTLLSYLFHYAAASLQKSKKDKFDYISLKVSEALLKKHNIESFGANSKKEKLKSTEFENFLKKYLSLIIVYVIEETSNLNIGSTRNEKLREELKNIDILSFRNLIINNKEYIVDSDDIFGEKLFKAGKQTADISREKKGNVNIELAAVTESFHQNSEKSTKTSKLPKESTNESTEKISSEDIIVPIEADENSNTKLPNAKNNEKDANSYLDQSNDGKSHEDL